MPDSAGTLIDHIIVVAPDLTAGAAFVRNALGVEPRRGGAHPRMGTHNLLLPLGGSCYLEIVAPDPDAPDPGRARWFALDQLGPHSQPRLAAWAVRTRDIYKTNAACAVAVGAVEPMTRGALSWLITVPPDGSLPLGGAAPALIEWRAEPHPANMLDDAGCTLVALEIFHPEPSRVNAVFSSIELESPPHVWPLAADARPYLVAQIETPHGRRTLSAP